MLQDCTCCNVDVQSRQRTSLRRSLHFLGTKNSAALGYRSLQKGLGKHEDFFIEISPGVMMNKLIKVHLIKDWKLILSVI